MASTAASPSVYSPPTRSKRSASVTSSDYGESPPVKKKATSKRSSAADKEYKKEERMERNRKAAQASRDRKKLQQEGMEARIADLERQLAAAQQAPAVNLDPLPLPPCRATSSSSAPHRVISLEEENESLRTQLQLEQLQSATLKVRLGALETKFARLDDLLRGDSSTSTAKLASPMLPPLPTPPTAFSLPSLPTPPAPTAFPFLDDVSPAALTSAEPSSKLETGPEGANDDEKDSLRLVAREVDSSLPRKLSQRRRLAPLMTRPSSLTPSSSSPMARTPSTPTLHRILSSISINPPPRQSSRPSTTSPSPTPGTIGRSASTSALKTRAVVRLAGSGVGGAQRRDLGARRLNSRRRSRTTEQMTEACSRSSRMRRFQLFVRR